MSASDGKGTSSPTNDSRYSQATWPIPQDRVAKPNSSQLQRSRPVTRVARYRQATAADKAAAASAKLDAVWVAHGPPSPVLNQMPRTTVIAASTTHSRAKHRLGSTDLTVGLTARLTGSTASRRSAELLTIALSPRSMTGAPIDRRDRS